MAPRRVIVLLVCCWFVISAPVAAEITGKRPGVIDGDTIDFTGLPIRLHGIDAPELAQTCSLAGEDWNCGLEARWAAIYRISNNWVTCLERGRSSDGVLLAVCYLGGVGGPDLAEWMVAQGWALATPSEAPSYIDEESGARAARRGLWRGDFLPPWEWRARQ